VALAVIVAAALSAQEQPASGSNEALPNRGKAMENALRNLLRNRAATWGSSSAKAMNASPGRASCGYIRIFPAHPGLDPRIVVPVPDSEPGDGTRSRTPVFEVLPPCDPSGR
jgi:hypothetical protein